MPRSGLSRLEERQELASDLIDISLLKLKKLVEMRRLMQQELHAIEGKNYELLLLILNQRQALLEQLSAIDLDYQHQKRLVARQVYLDDLDFDSLLTLLPPEAAEYLRKANTDQVSIAWGLVHLSEEIQEQLAKQQVRSYGRGPVAEPDWTAHPVYQYSFTFSAGESRLKRGRSAQA